MLLLWLLAVVTTCSALRSLPTVTNTTIDDNFGDWATGQGPSYSPQIGWFYGPDCLLCFVAPNPAYANKGSWHTATDDLLGITNLQVTLTFTGTALYVYNIIPTFVTFLGATATNLRFTMDGTDAGSYVVNPSGNGWTFNYNVPVYVNESLANTTHIFTMSPVDGSVVFFDYAIYSTQSDDTPDITSSSAVGAPTVSASPAPSPSSRPSTALIAGAAIGGTASFAMIVAFIFMCCWHKRRCVEDGKQAVHDDMVEAQTKPTADWTLVPQPFVPHTPLGDPYPFNRRESDAPTYASEIPRSGYFYDRQSKMGQMHGWANEVRRSKDGGSAAWMQSDDEPNVPLIFGRQSSEYGYGAGRYYVPAPLRRASTIIRHDSVLEVRNPDAPSMSGEESLQTHSRFDGRYGLITPPPPAYQGDHDDRMSSCPGTIGHSEKGP